MASRTMLMNFEKLPANGTKNEKGYSQQGVYRHDADERDINADPALTYLNRTFVDRIHGGSVDEYIRAEYQKLYRQGSERRAMRRDAKTGSIVLEACGVYLEEGKPPADFDMEGWVRKSLEWADREFNPPGKEIHYTDRFGRKVTGKTDNIYYAVLHLDETSPHLHIMVMPVSERGTLSCYSYTGVTRTCLSELQDRYYEAVREFGLDRGANGCRTDRKKIEYYRALLARTLEKEPPVPEQGETIREYRQRITEDYQAYQAHMHNQDMQHAHEARIWEGRPRAINRYIGLGARDNVTSEEYKAIARERKELKLMKEELRKDLEPGYVEDLYRRIRSRLDEEDRERKKRKKEKTR